MDAINFAWAGAAFGAIAGCWRYIKDIGWKICSLLIQRVEIGSDYHAHHLSSRVVSYLVKHYRRSAVYDRFYKATAEHIRPENRSGTVAYEMFGCRSLIFWKNCFPFMLQIGNGNETKSSDSSGDKTNEKTNIIFIRGTLDIDQIIANAITEYNQLNWRTSKESRQRFFIKYIPEIDRDGPNISYSPTWFHEGNVRLLTYRPNDLGPQSISANSLQKLIFPKRILTLIEEIKLWQANKDWYQKRGIPWKRGWMLYGPGGTGKTALARAFAEDLDLPIFVFYLAELSNHELMQAWLQMRSHAPCIALIEDIDNVFHGRENVASRNMGFWPMYRRKKKKTNNQGTAAEATNDKQDDEDEKFFGGVLNFDVLLNCIDGVERSEGIFTIITTNDVSKIDSALAQPRTGPDRKVEYISSRPGRIDKAIELTYMENDDKLIMAKRIVGEYPEALKEVWGFVKQYPDLQETPAQFQERCSQMALACFWRQQQKEKEPARKEAKRFNIKRPLTEVPR